VISDFGWGVGDDTHDDGTIYFNATGTYYWPSSMLPATQTSNPLDTFSKDPQLQGKLLQHIESDHCPVLEGRGVYDLKRY